MVNYSQGKLYRIVPNCEHDPHEQYIGSTTKQYLSQRFAQHKIEYRCFKSGNRDSFTTSFKLFDKYGVENCSIVLIENVCVHSKEDLHKKEREHIEKTPCVNKCIPLRTMKEWRLKFSKEKIEYIALTRKKYYDDNKELNYQGIKKIVKCLQKLLAGVEQY